MIHSSSSGSLSSPRTQLPDGGVPPQIALNSQPAPDNANLAPTSPKARTLIARSSSSQQKPQLMNRARDRGQTVSEVTKRLRAAIDRALDETPEELDNTASHGALSALHELETQMLGKDPAEVLKGSTLRNTLRTINRHEKTLGLSQGLTSGLGDSGVSKTTPDTKGSVIDRLSPKILNDLATALTMSPVKWKDVDKLAAKLGAELAQHLGQMPAEARHEFLGRSNSKLHRQLVRHLRAAALPQPGLPVTVAPRRRKSVTARLGSLLAPSREARAPGKTPKLAVIDRAVAAITRSAGMNMGHGVLKSGSHMGDEGGPSIPLVANTIDFRTGASIRIDHQKYLASGGYASAHLYGVEGKPDTRLVCKIPKSDDVLLSGFDSVVQLAMDREVHMHMQVMRDQPAKVVGLVSSVPDAKGMNVMVLEFLPKGEIGTLSTETFGNPVRLAALKGAAGMTSDEFDTNVANAKRALVGDVLDGINQVHLAGVSHNDISPSNFFISADGVGKVADFGNARAHTTMKLNAFGEGLTQMQGAYPIQFLRRAAYRDRTLQDLDQQIAQATTAQDQTRLDALRSQRATLVELLDPSTPLKPMDPFLRVGHASPDPTSKALPEWGGYSETFKIDSRAPDYWNAAMAIYDILAPLKNPLIYEKNGDDIDQVQPKVFARKSEQLAAAADDQARQAILFEGVTLDEVPQDMRDLITSMLSFDGSLPEYGQKLEKLRYSDAYAGATSAGQRDKLAHDFMLPESLLSDDVGSMQTRSFISDVLCGPTPGKK